MAQSAPASSALRPLTLGEILDRAVHVSVKNFPTLLVAWLPFGVLGYFASVISQGDGVRTWTTILGSAKPAVDFAFSGAAANVQRIWTIASLFCLLPADIALVAVFAAAYRNARLDAAAGLRTAVARLPATLLMVALLMLLFALPAIAVALGGYLVFESGLFARFSLGLKIGLEIALALAALAYLGVFVVVVNLGQAAVVIEGAGAGRATVAALRRGLARTIFRRTLGFACAMLAYLLGVYVLSGIVDAVAFGLLRSNALGLLVELLMLFLTSVSGVALQTVYYFDVRVRQEGLDLDEAAAALRTGP